MEGGHLRCVQYANQNGCDWEDSLIMAIKNNEVECFKYGYNNGAPYDEVVMQMLSPGLRMRSLTSYTPRVTTIQV